MYRKLADLLKPATGEDPRTLFGYLGAKWSQGSILSARLMSARLMLSQVIPEGEGPVKTLVLFSVLASFLVLAGRVEVGVGVKAGRSPTASGCRALTAASFGACCSG